MSAPWYDPQGRERQILDAGVGAMPSPSAVPASNTNYTNTGTSNPRSASGTPPGAKDS